MKSMKRKVGIGLDRSQRETPDNPKGHKLGPRMPKGHVFGLLLCRQVQNFWLLSQAQMAVNWTRKRAFLQMSRTFAKGDLF